MTSNKASESAAPTTRSSRQSKAIARLEQLARRDPGGRGLSSKAPLGLLEPAAAALLAASRIVIVTGFCVRSAMIGETDGPPGATALAAALLGLGKQVQFLTDTYSADLIAAALAVRPPIADMQAQPAFITDTDPDLSEDPDDVDPDWEPGLPVTIALLPDNEEEAPQVCRTVTNVFAPDLILAVERPGSAVDGHRYSMRGSILDDIAPSADSLFGPPENRFWKTVAIGDGGNELGMGSLRDACVSAVAMGEQIFCTAAADFPIAAGISNWGAYALAGAISILAGRAVLPHPDEELAALQGVYQVGGVDGATREHTCTVDGLPADEYLQTIRQMYKLVLESI